MMSTDILSKIVAIKKEEVAAARRRMPLAQLLQKPRLPWVRRPFFQRLAQPGPNGPNIIAEIKKASPTKGSIRPDLDPARYAAMYESAGAAAISVLTDTSFFKGSVDDLQTARRTSSLPVLRKDFIISEYQIYEALHIGADAVLLIVRILSPNQLSDYLALSRDLGMDALVEIHSESDLEAASHAGARLIGINNRNLQSFKTDLKTSVRLASLLAPSQVAVAESGIKDRAAIEMLLKAGIFNFLIGESLVRAGDPGVLIKSFLGN